MDIKVLGTGCPKCRKLEKLVHSALEELGIDANVSKVETIPEIMAYGVAFTPALVIDGNVKCSGRLPKPTQLNTWLRQAAGK